MSTKRRTRHSPEHIVRKFRDADAMLNAGKDLAAVLQTLAISESTLDRWRTLLEHKPVGFDYARPSERWNFPSCCALLRRRPESDDRRHGTRSFIRVLRLVEKVSLPQLTQAVEYALDIDVIDADSIRTIPEYRAEQPVALFPLDGRPHLAHVRVETTDVSCYQTLLTEATP